MLWKVIDGVRYSFSTLKVCVCFASYYCCECISFNQPVYYVAVLFFNIHPKVRSIISSFISANHYNIVGVPVIEKGVLLSA